jgi:outer membrane protein assembly factor BamB
MRRPLLIVGAVVVLLVGGAGAYLYLSDEDPPEKRGSAAVEFDEDAGPPKPKPPARRVINVPWPTFGYDVQRTKSAPYKHRPPYRRTWRLDAGDTIEFPPSVGYGNVYVAQQKGRFFALDGKTGKPAFKTKDFGRCAASSPTVGRNGTVYQSYMHPVGDLSDPCPQGAANPDGFVIAMDARTGRQKWRFESMPIESSPLLRGKRLFVGSWDGNVYALNARNGKQIWSSAIGSKVNASPAYFNGRIYVADYTGTLHALDARTGRRIWSASDATEFYYATPVAAYGRIYIGSTDGTMYAYGARTGNLLWAKPLGTYVYSSAAVYQRKVYVGSYDGQFYALDAATGDVRWQREMPSSVHAPPVVLDGLVYVATCATCGSAAQRYVKNGVDSTTAFNARNGRRVWRNRAGKYSSPIVADQDRVYLTGRSMVYGMRPVTRKQVRQAKARRAKRARQAKQARQAKVQRSNAQKRKRSRSKRR